MPRIGFRELRNLATVVAKGSLLRYSVGPNGFTNRFEAQFAKLLGVKHVLTVNSGTSALIAALIGAGIGPGDEVLLPAFTFIATPLAVLAVGAIPVAVDIDDTLTIDPLELEKAITARTKAIIPVHMQNLVCNMDAIMAIAERHRLLVIEDAAQAVGVTYRNRRVGTIGAAGAFSFNPHKNMNCGEGGALLTNDDRIFVRARMYHAVGTYTLESDLNVNEAPFGGMNFRVSEITGAILYGQLPKLDPMLRRMRKRRRVIAEVLAKSKRLKISPHNDVENAVGLAVTFEQIDDAKKFAAWHGVRRLIDMEWNVYAKWGPLLARRTADERLNPYWFAGRKFTHSPNAHNKTLNLLKRTCRISVGENYPVTLMHMRAKMLLRSLA